MTKLIEFSCSILQFDFPKQGTSSQQGERWRDKETEVVFHQMPNLRLVIWSSNPIFIPFNYYIICIATKLYRVNPSRVWFIVGVNSVAFLIFVFRLRGTRREQSIFKLSRIAVDKMKSSCHKYPHFIQNLLPNIEYILRRRLLLILINR